MAGLDPAIHVAKAGKSWITGSSPVMTVFEDKVSCAPA
jgi:hypothetical protein